MSSLYQDTYQYSTPDYSQYPPPPAPYDYGTSISSTAAPPAYIASQTLTQYSGAAAETYSSSSSQAQSYGQYSGDYSQPPPSVPYTSGYSSQAPASLTPAADYGASAYNQQYSGYSAVPSIVPDSTNLTGANNQYATPVAKISQYDYSEQYVSTDQSYGPSASYSDQVSEQYKVPEAQYSSSLSSYNTSGDQYTDPSSQYTTTTDRYRAPVDPTYNTGTVTQYEQQREQPQVSDMSYSSGSYTTSRNQYGSLSSYPTSKQATTNEMYPVDDQSSQYGQNSGRYAPPKPQYSTTVGSYGSSGNKLTEQNQYQPSDAYRVPDTQYHAPAPDFRAANKDFRASNAEYTSTGSGSAARYEGYSQKKPGGDCGTQRSTALTEYGTDRQQRDLYSQAKNDYSASGNANIRSSSGTYSASTSLSGQFRNVKENELKEPDYGYKSKYPSVQTGQSLNNSYRDKPAVNSSFRNEDSFGNKQGQFSRNLNTDSYNHGRGGKYKGFSPTQKPTQSEKFSQSDHGFSGTTPYPEIKSTSSSSRNWKRPQDSYAPKPLFSSPDSNAVQAPLASGGYNDHSSRGRTISGGNNRFGGPSRSFDRGGSGKRFTPTQQSNTSGTYLGNVGAGRGTERFSNPRTNSFKPPNTTRFPVSNFKQDPPFSTQQKESHTESSSWKTPPFERNYREPFGRGGRGKSYSSGSRFGNQQAQNTFTGRGFTYSSKNSNDNFKTKSAPPESLSKAPPEKQTKMSEKVTKDTWQDNKKQNTSNDSKVVPKKTEANPQTPSNDSAASTSTVAAKSSNTITSPTTKELTGQKVPVSEDKSKEDVVIKPGMTPEEIEHEKEIQRKIRESLVVLVNPGEPTPEDIKNMFNPPSSAETLQIKTDCSEQVPKELMPKLRAQTTETHCHLCSLRLANLQQAVQHYNGKNHAKRVRLFVSSGGSETQMSVTTDKSDETKPETKSLGSQPELRSSGSQPDTKSESKSSASQPEAKAGSSSKPETPKLSGLQSDKKSSGSQPEAKSSSPQQADPPKSTSAVAKVSPSSAAEPASNSAEVGQATDADTSSSVVSNIIADKDSAVDKDTEKTKSSEELKDKKEEDNNEYCNLCGVGFTSLKQAEQHYQGKNHAKKVRLAEDAKSLEQAVSANIIKKSDNNVYECAVCNVMVTSQEQLDTHSRGTKHKAKLRQKEIEDAKQAKQSGAYGRGRSRGGFRGSGSFSGRGMNRGGPGGPFNFGRDGADRMRLGMNTGFADRFPNPGIPARPDFERRWNDPFPRRDDFSPSGFGFKRRGDVLPHSAGYGPSGDKRFRRGF